jgi:hypothetical protein
MTHQPKHDSGQALEWDSADVKLLLITVTGTLAANLATVVVVALGLLIAKRLHVEGVTAAADIFDIAIYLVAIPLAVSVYIRAKRRGKPTKAKLVIAIVAVIIGVFLLLSIVGAAVGVK